MFFEACHAIAVLCSPEFAHPYLGYIKKTVGGMLGALQFLQKQGSEAPR